MTRSSARSRAAFKLLKLSAVAFLVVGFSGAGASAGFLEDIFGPDPTPQAAPSSPAKRASRHEGRVKSELHFMPGSGARGRGPNVTSVARTDESSSSAGSKPVTAALCAPEAKIAGAAAPALLAYDKTLRNGDIMVTEGGLQVFRGHAACPHDARDFVALTSAAMPKNKRSMLLAIEEAMKRPSGYLLTAKFDQR